MARKPESQFITSVHRHVPSRVYKMKNHNAYIGGIADCWYSGSYTDLWAEYKFLPVKKPTATVVPALSPQQFAWIKDRKKEGRNVWVIVGYKSGGVIFTEVDDMERGMHPDRFALLTMSRKEIAEAIVNFCTKEPKCNQEALD